MATRPPLYKAPTGDQRRSSMSYNPVYRGLNEIITETPPEMAITTRQQADKQSNDKQSADKQDEKQADKQQMALNPKHTITYNGVVKILKDSYNFNENVTSTSLDILALYLKGQKIIYTESKTYCEKRLNTLMLPAIFIAAICSILTFILQGYSFGPIIISVFNVANSFILSIINYLKLAEKSQNHLMAAQRFHNLESRIELQSGRSLFFGDSVNILNILEEIEREIKEIQSSDQFIVPEAIRYRYPKTYSANLFAMVKEIKNKEMLIINELKSAVQEIYLKTEEKNELIHREKVLTKEIAEMQIHLNELELNKELIEFQIADLQRFISKHDAAEQENDSDSQSMKSDDIGSYDPEDEPLTRESIEKDTTMDVKEKENLLFNLDRENELRHARRAQKELENVLKYQQQMRKRERFDRMENLHQLEKRLTETNINAKHADIAYKQKTDELDMIHTLKMNADDEIALNDDKKNEAFKASVNHRQKYIELSDELNKEINAHIDRTNMKTGCHPCKFFNT